MPGAHRHGDARFCGATTVATGQSTLIINDKVAAVEGDKNTHGNGDLIASYGDGSIIIENQKLICAVGDTAQTDNQGHPSPLSDPSQSSSDVILYEGS